LSLFSSLSSSLSSLSSLSSSSASSTLTGFPGSVLTCPFPQLLQCGNLGIYYLFPNTSQFFFLNVAPHTNVTISTCNLFTNFDTEIQVGGNFPGGTNNDANCIANGTQRGKQSTVVLTDLPQGYNFTVNASLGNESGLYAVSIDCNGLNPRVFNPNGSSNSPSVAPFPFYSNYTIINCVNLTYLLNILGGTGGFATSSSSSLGSTGLTGSSGLTGLSGLTGSSGLTGISSSSTGTGSPYSSTGNGANVISASPFVSFIFGALLFIVAW